MVRRTPGCSTCRRSTRCATSATARSRPARFTDLHSWLKHQPGVPQVGLMDLGCACSHARPGSGNGFQDFDSVDAFISEASYDEDRLVSSALQSTALSRIGPAYRRGYWSRHSFDDSGHRCRPGPGSRCTAGVCPEWIHRPSDRRSGRAHLCRLRQQSHVRHAGQFAVRAAPAWRDL